MGQSKPFPPSPVERPLCPKCKTRMMLARLELGPPGFELPSFDCPKCDHVMTVEVADPLEAAKGWLSSELQPPK